MKEKRATYLKNKIVFLFSFIVGVFSLSAQTVTIPVATEDHMLLLQTDNINRLRTIYFGKPLENVNEYAVVSTGYNYDEFNSGIYRRN
jgi:alpha-galactosidase